MSQKYTAQLHHLIIIALCLAVIPATITYFATRKRAKIITQTKTVVTADSTLINSKDSTIRSMAEIYSDALNEQHLKIKKLEYEKYRLLLRPTVDTSGNAYYNEWLKRYGARFDLPTKDTIEIND